MKILLCAWPFPGHYFPLVAIGHELRARGHDVAFYTGAQAGPTIEGEGFRWFPFRAIDEGEFAAMIVDRERFASSRQPARMRALLAHWLLGTLDAQVKDVADAITTWRPDLVVTETAMWGPSLILRETHDVPVAIFSTVAACMLPGPDAPPFGVALPPPRSWATRLLAHGSTRLIDWFAASFRQAANAKRAEYGLAPLRVSVTEHLGTLPLYLMPSVPEFDYQRTDLPPSVRYIGPCIWNKPVQEPPPAWLATLGHDQPWVHVSEGTVNSQQPFVLRAAAQGLGDQPMHVIMTTGGNRDPEALDLGHIAPNIHLVRWIAHSDLLPQTDVLVTTGGAGTVIAALRAGVPQVIVPTEWDKPENARRIIAAGVGVRVRLRDCTPERLREAVMHVLSDPSYRRNAQHMGELLRAHDGPLEAAQLLETLCPDAVEETTTAGVAG